MRRYLIDENISPQYRTQLLYHEPSLTVLVIGDEGAPAKGTSDPEILVWCEQNLYCLRFFRPLPKGRLCYNDNLN